jgi:hypothetical protein
MNNSPDWSQESSFEQTAEGLGSLVEKARNTPLGADPASSRAYDALAELSEELHNGVTDRFTGLNPVGSLPPETLLPDRLPRASFVRGATALTVLRDLSVFFPVAYTWFSLSEVLPAYHNIPGDSFIGDWAAGVFPDGRGGAFFAPTLGSTALVIAGVIALIILMTFISHALTFLTEQACDLSAERRQLARLLASVELRVSSSISAQDQVINSRQLEVLGRSFSGGTAALQDTLTRVGDEIRTSLDTGPGSRFGESLDGWTAAAAALVAATDTLRAPAEALREFLQTQNGIIDAQLQLSRGMGDLVAQIKDYTKATAEGAHLRRGVESDVARAAQKLGETLTYFENRVSKLDAALQAIQSTAQTGSQSSDTSNDYWDKGYGGSQ